MAEHSAPPITQVLPRLVSRRWWWVTLLVLVGIGVLIRLGVWQLHRLEQRRAQNAATLAQLESSSLVLDGTQPPPEVAGMADRPVTVSGELDLERQFVLLNERLEGQAGVRLFAPLRIAGSERAILVDRGWLPEAQQDPAAWAQYDVSGTVTIAGFLQKSIRPPRVGPENYANSVAAPLREWYWAYIPAIEKQLPYETYPVYVRQSPAESSAGQLPRRTDPEFDLSEGPHLGYAIQWFLFATILAGGYVLFVRRQESEKLAI